MGHSKGLGLNRQWVITQAKDDPVQPRIIKCTDAYSSSDLNELTLQLLVLYTHRTPHHCTCRCPGTWYCYTISRHSDNHIILFKVSLQLMFWTQYIVNTEPANEITWFKAWISNFIHTRQWDLITLRCNNSKLGTYRSNCILLKKKYGCKY